MIEIYCDWCHGYGKPSWAARETSFDTLFETLISPDAHSFIHSVQTKFSVLYILAVTRFKLMTHSLCCCAAAVNSSISSQCLISFFHILLWKILSKSYTIAKSVFSDLHTLGRQ